MGKRSRLIVLAVLGLAGCTQASAPSPSPTVAAVDPPPMEAPVQPLLDGCGGQVKTAEKAGLIRPGTVDKDGAVILTDGRWATRLDADLQKSLAECVSHYLAGGQNRWTKRVQFRNQVSGVVYATIEGDRFRIGE